jgi:hypothetical protein
MDLRMWEVAGRLHKFILAIVVVVAHVTQAIFKDLYISTRIIIQQLQLCFFICFVFFLNLFFVPNSSLVLCCRGRILRTSPLDAEKWKR